MKKLTTLAIIAALSFGAFFAAASTAGASEAGIKGVVDTAVRPVMQKNHISGMAIGLVVDGKPYVFNYGLAAVKGRKPVTDSTLFELGSVSKTFTATLASYAQAGGALSLSDPVSKYLPELQGTPFGNVSLLELGTHTPGGIPLQVPDGITNLDQLMLYFKKWRPAYAPGTYRTYANTGIGTLGLITAIAMHGDFNTLMAQQLFPALGMTSTYIDVPAAKMADYAWGYKDDGSPVRMTPGVLWAQAYGVRTTAGDMVRYLEDNMSLLPLDARVRRALVDTHTGYFKAGPMTQDLIWEQYPYPVELASLLEGNSASMIFDPHPVSAISPPQKPLDVAWINKTGSTNGFATYVAFVPQRRLGIVLLANKNYPIPDRVALAYAILKALNARD